MGLEVDAGRHLALHGIVAAYVPWTATLDRPDDDALAGAVARGRVVWSWRERRASGPWVAPFVQAGGVRGTNTGTLSAWAAGLSLGYRFNVVGRWQVLAGGGLQWHQAGGGSALSPRFAGWWPQADVLVVHPL